MKIGIQTKIAGLITIPLLAFIVMAAISIKSDWQQLKIAQKTLEGTELFASVSDVVHALQKEREDLLLQLLDRRTAKEMAVQREVADRMLSEFRLKMANHEFGLQGKSILTSVSDLSPLRKSIDQDGISGEACDRYNHVIQSLIGFEVQVAHRIALPGVSSSLLSMNILEQSRESADQLRAMLLPVLLANAPLSTLTFSRIERLHSDIHINLESPLLEASSDVTQFLTTFKASENYTLVMMIYDAIIAKANEGQYGLDLNGFFDSISAIVTDLDRPGMGILRSVRDSVNATTRAAERAAALMAAMIAVSTVVIFILVRVFTGRLSSSLELVAQGLMRGAGDVSEASRNMSGAAHGISTAASEQTQSLSETTTAVEKISQMVRANADRAQGSKGVAEEAVGAARQGREIVSEVVRSMQEIHDGNMQLTTQITDSNREIERVIQVINEIGEKTKVINEIVFQTKLLSFNASVEAARAGEAGKGFAVVAEEIGNLATLSGHASKEINDMLKQGIEQVGQIVRASQEKLDRLAQQEMLKIGEGSEKARVCGEVLEQIGDKVETMKSMLVGIAEDSMEQARGVQEITEAVGDLQRVTEANAQLSEQTSGSADAMAQQSLELNQLVQGLNHIITGDREAA
ncbi:MAG: nitrate- and nitrite sensing domain-containing protein [Bdellovibrionales bacterium]|nr:nitrate- and nitrite sensing domain-containing protein [Bdellovibrionales bacterium]